MHGAGWAVAIRRGVAGAALALLASVSQGAERSAHGLIVKLRDATAHEAQLSLAPGPGATPAEARNARMQRVIDAAAVAVAGLRPVGRSALHLDFGHVLAGAEAERLAARLRARPEVEWVVANERERRLQVPGDPYFSSQWWLKSVSGSNANALADRLRGVPGFQSAWIKETGKASAVVAVLDTGITRHPELDAHVLPGRDFVSTLEYADDGDGRDGDASDPGDAVSAADRAANPALFSSCKVEDSSWHGTNIAGIVAAVTDNGDGVAAASWDARVLPVRVAGKCGADVADIIDGMRWAAGLAVSGAPLNPNPARVVNISFGGSAACNPAYQDAIDELNARGVVVVAAAGNEHAAPTRPASCRGVVGVAALNRDGFKTSYSNFGPALVIATVGGDAASIGAWGPALGDEGLLTVDNSGKRSPANPIYSRVFGTSFAAPVVAGVVSLMLSANPALTVAQITNGLRLSARPHVVSPKIAPCSTSVPGRCLCTGSTCGAGILDAEQAVLYALDPAAYVPPARTAASIDSAEIDAAVALGPDLPPNGASTNDGGASDNGSDAAAGGALSLPWLLALGLAVALVAARHNG